MSSRINFIQPKYLNNETISSWFTLRNKETVHPKKPIGGLNLGLNTDEAASTVLANRQLLLNEIGIEESQIVYAVQVHQTDVKVVQKGGVYENTDGFVTTEPGLALAIQVADCAAVLMGDPQNGVVGAAHAGWRGAAGGIIPKTIQKMRDQGGNPSEIKVFVSPCISLKNFEVGEEVAKEFPDDFVDRTKYAKPHVNLKAFLRQQLVDAGIEPGHIEINDSCTIENENFYSYRRQKEKSGRMMGIIKLNGLHRTY